MTIYWFCLHCEERGETTGTEYGADVKHSNSAGHVTCTTTNANWKPKAAHQ